MRDAANTTVHAKQGTFTFSLIGSEDDLNAVLNEGAKLSDEDRLGLRLLGQSQHVSLGRHQAVRRRPAPARIRDSDLGLARSSQVGNHAQMPGSANRPQPQRLPQVDIQPPAFMGGKVLLCEDVWHAQRTADTVDVVDRLTYRLVDREPQLHALVEVGCVADAAGLAMKPSR